MGHKNFNCPYISVRLNKAQLPQFLAFIFTKFWLTVWQFLCQVVRSLQQEPLHVSSTYRMHSPSVQSAHPCPQHNSKDRIPCSNLITVISRNNLDRQNN